MGLSSLARSLQGMFAFAVWDEHRRRLVLGRDRFGKKPLYYWSDGARFVFGSEIKAVLADPFVPKRLDPDAIPAYLTFGYVPTPRTFFEGVRSVPPGHVLPLNVGGTAVLERYWQPPMPGRDGVDVIDCGFEEARRETRRSCCVTRSSGAWWPMSRSERSFRAASIRPRSSHSWPD